MYHLKSNKQKSLKKILLLILFLPVIFPNCNFSNNSQNLTKLGQNELLSLFENFNSPNIKELTIRNMIGDSITLDSARNIFIPGQHAFDYYKNAKGKIVECRIRKYTKEDEAFQKELNRTKVKLSKLEIDEIRKLDTPKQKSAFLHGLWQDDQDLRRGQEAEIMAKYGQNSDEHKSYLKTSIRENGRIFIKLKKYLELHGYPQKQDLYHELALNAFPTIIGHNHNYDEQFELIQHLYKSYKEGYCKVGELVWVMGEMHESKHYGKRYEMKSNRYTGIEEFNELNEVLKLGFELNESEQ